MLPGQHKIYYASLDGLRAISILAVLIYHLNPQWLPGGFLGVETFFVISGFIITVLLIEEWKSKGNLSYLDFYYRRFKRLLPEMLLMIGTTLLVVWLLYPEELRKTMADLCAGTGFFLNWSYIVQETSYFERMGRPPVFEHLWSLSVEFQFYLVWPFICVLLFKSGHRAALLWMTVLALASSAWMLHGFMTGLEASRLYFGTDTRISGLMIGAAVAVYFQFRQNKGWIQRSSGHFLGFVAGLSLLLCYVYWDDMHPWLYPGGFLLTACISALCILAGLGWNQKGLGSFLGNSMLLSIGLRSYSLYLWHWPIFSLTGPMSFDLSQVGKQIVFRLILTGILAECSYRIAASFMNRKREETTGSAAAAANKNRKYKIAAASMLLLFTGSMLLYFNLDVLPLSHGYLAVASQQKALVEMRSEETEAVGLKTNDSLPQSVAATVYEGFRHIRLDQRKHPVLFLEEALLDGGLHLPELKDGKTCVPIRALVKPLLLRLHWDDQQKMLTIEQGNKIFKLDYKNKQYQTILSAWTENQGIYIKEDMAYLPIRVLAEALGYKVLYEAHETYPMVTLTYENSLQDGNTEILKSKLQKRDHYIRQLRANVEARWGQFNISFSPQQTLGKSSQPLGSALLLQIQNPQNDPLTVYWSTGQEGDDKWEMDTRFLESTLTVPDALRWEAGHHQIYAKVENAWISRIVSAQIQVEDIPKKTAFESYFIQEKDPKTGYILRLSPATEKKRTVLAIGDSVMIGAANKLYEHFGEALSLDAKVGRQFHAAKSLIQAYEKKGILPDIVLLHLGNNGLIGEGDLREVLAFLQQSRQVYLMNIKVPLSIESRNNAMLKKIGGSYANVKVLDWYGSSRGENRYFAGDGYHLNLSGAEAYAQMVWKTLKMGAFGENSP